jgi:hypothetical protein
LQYQAWSGIPSIFSKKTMTTTAETYKKCATPGCTLRDFHNGACSHQLNIPRRVPEQHKVTNDLKESNRFQYNLEFARFCIHNQFVDVIVPPDLCNKLKIPFPNKGHVLITDASKIGRKVVDVAYHYGADPNVLYRTSLTSEDLLRHDVDVTWQQPSAQVMERHKASLNTTANANSARRMKVFCKVMRETWKTGDDDYCLGLDGHGANRDAYTEKPKYITYEIDPDAALSQQLLFGRDRVIWTGGMVKEKFGYGTIGLENHPPGIEYLIQHRVSSDGKNTENKLVTQAMCDKTVGLFLDYCGGPIGGLDYDRSKREVRTLLSRLPRLAVICITVGKRQRPNLEWDFESYVDTPPGFEVAAKFDGDSPGENNKVVSRIYKRIWQIPRTVWIHGSWWNWTQWKSASAVQRCQFSKGVIEAMCGDQIAIYVSEDNRSWMLEPGSSQMLIGDAKYKITDPCAIEDSTYETHQKMTALQNKMTALQKEMTVLKSQLSESALAPDTPPHEPPPHESLHEDRSMFNQMPIVTTGTTRSYTCSLCKVPKKGHKCPIRQPPPRKPYLCGICKKPKKNHVCITTAASLVDEMSRV